MFVITSRPDVLDATLLISGRLDCLLFYDFPSRRERMDILSAFYKCFSSEVQLTAVHEVLEDGSSSSPQANL